MRVYHRTVKIGRMGGRNEDGEEGKRQMGKRGQWRKGTRAAQADINIEEK